MRLRLPPVLYPQMIGVTMKRDLAETEKRYLSTRGLKLGNTSKPHSLKEAHRDVAVWG